MYNVKIYGAGSIGNHLANACRNLKWCVTICDKDIDALRRTKNQTYPDRYGSWDDDIQLLKAGEQDNCSYDLVILGTPPDTHVNLALSVIENERPRYLLVEKPFSTPDLDKLDLLVELAEANNVKLMTGYNHTLTENTKFVEGMLSSGELGEILSISAQTREHWGGIFAAHQWLDGPHDSYLGYYKRGGGACCEHSHAINIWQHFAHFIGAGRIEKVSAKMDIVEKNGTLYDQTCFLSFVTENGMVGNVVQDVITAPTQKNARIQGEKGFVEWHVGSPNGCDSVLYGDAQETNEKIIKKTRPDDFKGEIQHIADILDNKVDYENSPIALSRGLDTMIVLAAAFKSHYTGKEVVIDYSKGYSLNSIN